MSRFLKIISLILVMAVVSPSVSYAVPQTKTGTAKSKNTKSKTTKSRKTKSKGTGSGKSKGKKRKGKAKTETSADVKRQQEATRKEIKLTEQQIRQNDAEVKSNLAKLGKIQGDIDVSRQKVATAGAKVKALQGKINTLQSQVKEGEKQLDRLRAEYLKAVKAMRTKRKEKSMLAFIFSSKSFNEAMRRVRYLKQFSAWRDNQSKEITSRVATLKRQTDDLARTKSQHDRQLAVEVKARDELQKEYARQDAVVGELRKNGQALRTHLARKQTESNALKNRVAALIAEETRKAEAERAAAEKARQEAEARRAAEERARQEAEAKAAREAEAKAAKEAEEAEARAAKAAKEAKEAKEKEAKAAKAKAEKEAKAAKEAKEKAAKAKAKADKKAKEVKEAKKQEDKEVSYAEARRRRPKSKGGTTGASLPGKKNAESAGGSFESMRGALPRPVGGSFRVTSRFGRQSVPDMPDVSYDNPGIDAEVAAGANACAVYDGKVSGVYVVPGFSTVVIVSHGTYYTVYGHLSAASVKTGDQVRGGQSIGRVAADEDNPSIGSIHFEVWKNREKLDPLKWIR